MSSKRTPGAEQAMVRLKEDVTSGSGRKLKILAKKGDMVEVKQCGESHVYIATNLKTKEKFSISREKLFSDN